MNDYPPTTALMRVTPLDRVARFFLAITPVAALAYGVLIEPLLALSTLLAGGGGQNINSEVAEGNTLNKLVWIGLAAIAVLSILRIRLASFRWQPALTFTLLLIVLAFASQVWSVVPEATVRRSILQLCIFIAVVGPICAGLDPRQLLFRVTMLFYLALILCILVIPIVPPSPLGLAGFYGQKNMLGQVSTIAMALAVWQAIVARRFRIVHIMIAIVAVALCLLSQSKTALGLSYICLIPLAAGYFLTRAHGIERLAIWAVLLIVTLSLGIWFLASGLEMQTISMLLFGDPTFTGRTNIWNFAADNIAQRPLLGFGYGAVWGVGDESLAVAQNAGFIAGLLQAHNGFIDAHLQLGLVGLLLMWAIVLTSISSAIAYARVDMATGLFCFYCLSMLYMGNAMETTFFRFSNPSWLMILVIFGCCTIRTKKPARQNYRSSALADAPRAA